MRRAGCAVLLALVAACSPAPAPPPDADVAAPAPGAAPVADAAPAPAPVEDPATAWENRLGNLPPDAAAVIRRVEACTRLRGQFRGDGTEFDREVNSRMDELDCNTVDADTVAVRAMYGDRPDVMEALDLATRGAR